MWFPKTFREWGQFARFLLTGKHETVAAVQSTADPARAPGWTINIPSADYILIVVKGMPDIMLYPAPDGLIDAKCPTVPGATAKAEGHEQALFSLLAMLREKDGQWTVDDKTVHIGHATEAPVAS